MIETLQMCGSFLAVAAIGGILQGWGYHCAGCPRGDRLVIKADEVRSDYWLGKAAGAFTAARLIAANYNIMRREG